MDSDFFQDRFVQFALGKKAQTDRKMNTKTSFMLGWMSYTAAFVVGGAIGVYNYKYRPGGRADREKAAEQERKRQEELEAIEEEKIREQLRQKKGDRTSVTDSLSAA